METFEIKEQVKLHLGRCLELVIDGIQFRLLRSFISVAIVGLAVAFMSAVLSKSLIERQITISVDKHTYPRRLLVLWLNRLSIPITEYEIAGILAECTPSDMRWKEFIQWGGCTESELRALQEVVKKERKYLRFFEELSERTRRAMVGQVEGYQIFHQLQNPDVFEKFESELKWTGKKFPGSVSEFKEFIDSWHATLPLRKKIIQGHTEAIARAKEFIGTRPVQEVIAEWNKDAKAKLETAGFYISPDELETVTDEARKNLKFKKVIEWFENPAFRNRFASSYRFKDKSKLTTDLIFTYAVTESGAERVMKILKEVNVPVDMKAEELCRTAQQYLEDKRLTEMETSVSALKYEQRILGFSSRVLWLILVSMLVCIVGVTNAMLMSVTERFKEIATMKCLGATDGFIMIHFMLESSLLGTAGGILGAVLGLVLGILSASSVYGTLALKNLSLLSLLGSALASIVCGLLISIISAVYPARVAARLAPMEAMRVE